jgi:arylsulfatase A-like enzyme
MTFTQAFVASFPTGPMRRDTLSGRFTFPYRAWQGEYDHGEAVLPEVLSQHGYVTAYAGDTPSNGGFAPYFDHFVFIKGQAGSNVELEPDETFDLPADPRKLRIPPERLQRIRKTEALWEGEEDRFVAQTMRAASRWLEGRYGQATPFFLMVDTFDPHEPWDPPRYYIDMYDPDYTGNELFEPAYEPADYATPDEIKHMRCLYAGEVSLVDRWIGYLLETVERLGMARDTAIIFTSDHGFYHGEHGLIGKVQLDREGIICKRWPLYDTIAHIPLLIKIPGLQRGLDVSDAFCQPPDLMPTILDLVDVPIPPTVQGQSLLPVIRGEQQVVRDSAISSLTYVQDDDVRSPTSFRTKDFLYVYGGDEWPNELYDLRQDAMEARNILDEALEKGATLHEAYLAFLEDIACPPERLEGRRQFRPERRDDVSYRRVI